jgi:hypothetical protein
MTEGKYGQLEKVNPDNTICIIFENFSGLCLFVLGKKWHENKADQQANERVQCRHYGWLQDKS